MNNIKQYINSLELREKLFLLIALTLLVFVALKLLIFDTQPKKIADLNRTAELIHQQQQVLTSLSTNPISSKKTANKSTLSNYLNQLGINNNLKQIRNTSSGGERYEFDDVKFTDIIQLLENLETSGFNQEQINITKQEKNGLVNVILVLN